MTEEVSKEAEGSALARLQTRAGYFLADDDFKAILVELKNAAIRKWADGRAPDAREHAWHDLQAVGRLENYLRALADGKTLTARKEDARKEKVSRR